MRELRERAEPILKAICVILAAMVLWQFIGVVRHWNPFRGVTVPELPTLTTSTNTPGGPATNLMASAGKGTNSPRNLMGTNVAGTNTATAGSQNQFYFDQRTGAWNQCSFDHECDCGHGNERNHEFHCQGGVGSD